MNDKYIEGAKNLIGSLALKKNDNLIILSDDENKEFSDYLIKAAKNEKINNVTYIIIPKIFRPVTNISDALHDIIKPVEALIHVTRRIPEENFLFNRPLKSLCNKYKCKYIYIYDPKIKYLKEGILANYSAVEKKAKKVKKLLQESENIIVTSELGTNISFSIYKHRIVPRSPVFLESMFENQAPEGEVMSCPVEKSFSGVIVVDGVVTGMGIPSSPIKWEFHEGFVKNVEGDKKYLTALLKLLKKSDQKLTSLIGLDIAEFSIGVNDWAVFDDNISNCEKVSGGIHFGYGQVKNGIGIYRGGTFHFDNILTAPTVDVIVTGGKKVRLIDKGKLTI